MSYKIQESILIEAEQCFVFDYTQDYGNRLTWDTFLKQADLINVLEPAIEVKAWCVSKYGLGMETQYVTYNRPKVTAVKLSKSNLVFTAFAGSWRFEDVEENITKVIFTYSFDLKFPFNVVGRLINSILSKNVQQRLIDLKNCVELKNK